jgi:hypothetical protein
LKRKGLAAESGMLAAMLPMLVLGGSARSFVLGGAGMLLVTSRCGSTVLANRWLVNSADGG